MDIRQVELWGVTADRRGQPRDAAPQLAIAGRSNVGKSSLLNWLWRTSLAKVAKAPGKTRTLNFYKVNESFYMVDLPGYGYAKVSKSVQAAWRRELTRYLAEEQRLAAVMTLIDIRHGPTALDMELQEMLLSLGRERLVVLTKADKVGRGQRSRMRDQVHRQLKLALPPVVVSVQSGEGRKELLNRIGSALDLWRERQRGD